MKRIRWDDILAEVAADWIARVLYFVGAFVAVAIGFPLLFGRAPELLEFMLHPEFWVLASFLGILVALFGPGVYRRYRQRGLGKLDEIRENSRMGIQNDIPFATPAGNPRRAEDEHV